MRAYFSPSEWPRVALMRPDVRSLLLRTMQQFLDETGLHTYVPERGGVRLEGIQALVYEESLIEHFRAAPPGESLHEKGAAGDLVIVGRVQNPERDQDDPDYRRLGEIGEANGLRAGIFWSSGRPDPYHYDSGETLVVASAKWEALKKKGSLWVSSSPCSSPLGSAA